MMTVGELLLEEGQRSDAGAMSSLSNPGNFAVITSLNFKKLFMDISNLFYFISSWFV